MKYGNLEITINMTKNYCHSNSNKQNKHTTKSHNTSTLPKNTN